MITLFVCNPEAALHAQLAADTDRAWLEYQRQEDLDHEEELAREAVNAGETEEWPWYANAPIEVVEPEEGAETVDAAAARTCPTCLDPIDDEDECSCIGPGWETP